MPINNKFSIIREISNTRQPTIIAWNTTFFSPKNSSNLEPKSKASNSVLEKKYITIPDRKAVI